MSLTIYGSSRSRTLRTLWLATELRLEFEHIAYEHDDPRLKEPAFLKLNPMGTIPTIVDDEFALSESLAINIYLAKKYGVPGQSLFIADAEMEAGILRWSLWAQGSVEPWVQRDTDSVVLLAPVVGDIEGFLGHSLNALEHALTASDWLLGDLFTLADLNVANILSPSRASRLDMAQYPNTRDWLGTCYSRPAAKAVRERFGG